MTSTVPAIDASAMATSRRLLYLTAESWPTFRVDVALLFGRHLPQLGIASDLVTARAPGTAVDAAWGGGDGKLCSGEGGQAKYYLRTFRHALRELWHARPARYDAVQVRDLPLPALFALAIARARAMSFFYWMSYPMSEGQIALARERGTQAGLMRFVFPWVRGHVGKLILYRMVLPRADHIFVQSDQMKRDLAARGLDPERMTPVPMGVDLGVIAPGPVDPAQAHLLRGRRVLVYLGTLERPRRIEALFEMLALLRPRFPDVLLLIVGDTEDTSQRDRLRRLAREAGVEDLIQWLGWLPMTTAWGWVSRAEVGLSPFPRGELLDSASPTKVVEYLALGVPVVCNDNPDQARVITDSGAGRCVPYTARDFAGAVGELLNLPAQEREAMVRSGREYVAQHRDYRKLASDLAATYHRLLDGNGSPGPSRRPGPTAVAAARRT